jgi:hypothetical protein
MTVLHADAPAAEMPYAYRILYHLFLLSDEELTPDAAIHEGRLLYDFTDHVGIAAPRDSEADAFLQRVDLEGRTTFRTVLELLELLGQVSI